jgi:flagellar motor switch protein FliM
VYPYVSIKPLRELLRSRVQEVDGNDESDKKWKHDLGAALGDSRVEMQVMLGQIQTTIAGFQALAPGDVLYFKKPEFARVMINEVPAFEAQIGTSGSDMAICIEKLIDPFTEKVTH